MTAVRSAQMPRAPGASAGAGWWGFAFVVVLAIHLGALYWPRVAIEGPVTWTDKVVHPLLFLVPVVVGSLWWRRVLPVAVVFAMHAPVSELVQHYLLPHRSGDPWDAAADLLGVVLGVLVPHVVAAVPATVWGTINSLIDSFHPTPRRTAAPRDIHTQFPTRSGSDAGQQLLEAGPSGAVNRSA